MGCIQIGHTTTWLKLYKSIIICIKDPRSEQLLLTSRKYPKQMPVFDLKGARVLHRPCLGQLICQSCYFYMLLTLSQDVQIHFDY